MVCGNFKIKVSIYRVYFPFILRLKALGTSYIVSQLDVYQCQIMIMENVWWRDVHFTLMYGREENRMVFLWTQAFIRGNMTKINFFSLKNKRETILWCFEEDWDITKGLEIEMLLFIYQLIFPLCDTKHSSLRGDERIPYYSNLEKWSNLYACQFSLGGSYGYNLNNINLHDIVHHYTCVARYGV